MLSELHIQNIAVIQKAAIAFKMGLNVFTGETGAGKTILISAIDAVLGERTSRDIIRSGEEKAQVSALFENISPKAKAIFEEMGYEMEDDSVLIHREITSAGKNSCRINGMPANVTMLKEIAGHLISIHGQRDTGQLLSPEQHLQMVDGFGELHSDIIAYQQQYQRLREAQAILKDLHMDEDQKAQRQDMLRFQIQEIEAAELEDIQEEERLHSQKKMVAGGEKIRQGLSGACNIYFGDGELTGLQEQLDAFLLGVEQASQHMEDLEGTVSRVEELSYEIQDIAQEIQSTLEQLEFDPQELDQIENRLNLIYNLKRKYGSSIAEIMGFHEAARQELETIEFSEQKQQELQQKIDQLLIECEDSAAKLSKKRAKACKVFLQDVEGELEFLDMPDVKLSVAHQHQPLGPLGTDHLEFMIVTNVGEEPKSLGKIASGGELARIMLAIKNVLADKDDIDTLIFDEIDTGVSGKAAGKIGRKLAQVSGSRQVICVTHLAQVAAFANNHLYIYKTVEGERTYTRVRSLDGEEAVQELARITSGEVITEAALESARELRKRAKIE